MAGKNTSVLFVMTSLTSVSCDETRYSKKMRLSLHNMVTK